ncbi:hypothetical protein [Clostridium oryzae]|uniref:hypothetical protein n=1 Tax=Clostridium oryzae TaxID=1450648 RepID=UPI001A9A6024
MRSQVQVLSPRPDYGNNRVLAKVYLNICCQDSIFLFFDSVPFTGTVEAIKPTTIDSIEGIIIFIYATYLNL